MLTLPESLAPRAMVTVCVPAVSENEVLTSAHVFQSAVVGNDSVCDTPSAEAVSVRVVFCPSPPVALA